MLRRRHGHHQKKQKQSRPFGRLRLLAVFFLFLGTGVLIQLFRLQVLHHKIYTVRASEQYTDAEKILPARGEIFGQDFSRKETVPLVVNETQYQLYMIPKHIENPTDIAKILAEALSKKQEEFMTALSKRDDPYERITGVITSAEKIRLEALFEKQAVPPAIYGFEEVIKRAYLEGNISAHVTGFWGFGDDGTTRIGQYGIEEYYNTELGGIPGIVVGQQDVQGRPIPVGNRVVEGAVDGTDVVLTIDRTVQYKACSALDRYVERFGATGGVVMIMDPLSGYIIASCGNPRYDPNDYGQAAVSSFIDPTISQTYEPGSIMKPITMSMALDVGAVTPWTTYNDTGLEKIGKYTIRNADLKGHGINTMIDVLDKSLNTGAIFAMRAGGAANFKKYIDRFGFGKLTGIELAGEADGDVSALEKRGEIYPATASFGQGIAVTPLQLVSAYAVIARGGVVVKPTIVASINGEEEPLVEGERIISEKTAETITLMLVSSVDNGYGKKGRVQGYKLAGKTGTAQIPKKDGPGYSDETMHSFIGFGPVDSTRKPLFVMLAKLDRPTEVRFSTDSATPLFGELAEFLLQYYEVPPHDL